MGVKEQVIGAAKIAALETAVYNITEAIKARFRMAQESNTISIRMQKWDDTYRPFLIFLSAQQGFPNRGRFTLGYNPLAMGAPVGQFGSPVAAPTMSSLQFHLIPEPTCLEWRMRGHRWSLRLEPSQDNSNPQNEVCTLTLHSPAKSVMDALIAEFTKFVKQEAEGKVPIYTISNGEWRQFQARQKRPLESVILERETERKAISFARGFFAGAESYASLGLEWRAGALFWGTAGSGKTSLAMALASECDVPIYCLSFSSKDLSDESLASLLNNLITPCIVVMEDMHVASSVLRGEESEASDLTLSGLLNCIDGLTSSSGRLIIGTSNEPPSFFPEPLVRAGRLGDLCLEFSAPTTCQLARLWSRFYPSFTEEAIQFATAFSGSKLEQSMASAQSLLHRHIGKPMRVFTEIEA